jgi:hypothetical protein
MYLKYLEQSYKGVLDRFEDVRVEILGIECIRIEILGIECVRIEIEF